MSIATAGDRLPVVQVSDSRSFDRSCANYYRQGNDAEVTKDIAVEFCTCIAAEIGEHGLGTDVLDFLGRTYSEDLTAFIDEYPKGEAWMESYFAAEKQCIANTDFGSNEASPQPSPGDLVEAGSWGGVVRDGPGKEFRRLATLEQGEHVMLLENTGVEFDGYPWWKIEFSGRREGYQWGGILCSLDAPVEGLYETCE